MVQANLHSHDFITSALTNSTSGNFALFTIWNQGNPQLPFGTVADLARPLSPLLNQRVVWPFRPITSIVGIRYFSNPVPLVSLTTDLPKGSCIDLSLSGFATDDPIINSDPTLLSFRDCRRMFASDWSYPNPNVPAPQQLRPVSITFGPDGSLLNVSVNGPSSPVQTRTESMSDVFLFVGRTDQVVQPIHNHGGGFELDIEGLEEAVELGLKPNLLDPTGYWVRIAASSGAISAAPARQLGPAEIQIASANDVSISELLNQSRTTVYTEELTSQ